MNERVHPKSFFPVKQTDLQKCSGCGNGIAHGQNMMVTIVRVQRYIINGPAVQRQHGAELMMGNHILANILGPNEDMLMPIEQYHDHWLCLDCQMKPLIHTLEAYNDRQEG